MAVALSALLLPVFSRSALAVWPSIEDYGSSGGSGPVGGIGDEQHPVTEPLSFVTDSLILIPGTNTSTRQLARGVPPVLLQNNQSQSSDCSAVRRSVVVDATQNGAQQEMLGFGSAWTDSAVEVFDELEEPLRRQVMNDLFGQDGNNQGFMRHTIGSSDLSYHQYSYDDNGPGFNQGQPDPTLANFGLGPYGTRMAEYTAMMGEIKGDVFLFGAPWSLPGWMKNNGLFVAPTVSDYSTSTHFLWNNSLNPEYIPSAIQYFARYVDAFKEKGVTINGVSAQNEPLNYIGGTTTMYLDAVDEASMLLRGLGGLMHQRDVKFMAYDHNTDQPVYPARVLQGAGTDNVDAIAWHCYQGPVADYAVLDDLHLFSPKTVQFMTECSNTGATAGSTNYWVAQNFIPAVQHGASGASMWVMATNEDFGPRSPYGGCETCLPSIFVNSSSHYEKTIDYYMIGHFSRFIRRGAINHQVVSGNTGTGTSWSSQFWILAERNPDGGWAVVMMNNKPDDQLVTLSFIGSLNVWEGTVPAETVVTWMLPSDARVAANSSLASGAESSGAPYSLTNSTSPGSPTGSGIFPTATGVSSDSTCVASTATSSSSSSSSGTNLPVPNTDQIIITAGPGPTGASGGSDEGVCPTAPQATVTVSSPYGGDQDGQGQSHGSDEQPGDPYVHGQGPNEQAGDHGGYGPGPHEQADDHAGHGQGPRKHGGHGRHGGHRHGWGGHGPPHH
ncbi:hypothetical protein KC330_g1263 [Hortaea werneckii]|nr:hypothetical protein KC330_g1263 [Hortaea werneckii]